MNGEVNFFFASTVLQNRRKVFQEHLFDVDFSKKKTPRSSHTRQVGLLVGHEEANN